MKKVLSYAAALVAMFATSACSNKELTPTPDVVTGQTIKVKIHGGVAETKTGVEYDADDKAYYPYWNEDDQISVFFDEFGTKTKVDASLTNANAKGSEADFSSDDVTVQSGTILKEEGVIYSFYPKSAFQAVASDKVVRLNLKTNQEPVAVDTFDPAADILVGQPSDYLYMEDYLVAEIAFARVMSVVKVTLKAANDCPENIAINKFTMTAPDGTVLTGRSAISLATLNGDDDPIGEWTVRSNEVSALYNGDFHPIIGGSENTVYVIVNPTTITSGSEVTFTMESDNYNISKTVTLSKALAFPQSNVANINLTIANENCEPVVTETRIYVENFSNVTTSATQPQPNATGAAGTGKNQNTSYNYGSDNNTNIRFNINGHSNTDPYLFLRANATFTISNISVSEVSSLQFKAQTKNAGSVILKYKESSAEDWNTVETWTTADSFGEQSSIFSISNSATSLDFSFTAGSNAAVIIDDIVIDQYVDRHVKLDTPENLVAELDENVPNKVNISWDAVENASAYEVVLSADEKDDIVRNPVENSLVVEGLSYNTTYDVKVKATTNDPENYYDSEFTSTASVTTGAKPAGAATWDETAFADLADGDQVVIVGTSGENTYAMSNNNGTSSAPTAVSINVAGTALAADPVETLIWYVGVSEGNKIFYSDEDNTKWLYCTATNNGVRVGTNDNKTFTWDSSFDYLKHVGTGRYIGVYNTSDWRCYSVSNPSTHTNIGSQTFKFYVCSNKETKYSVSVAEVDGGTLSADLTKATEGSTVTLSADANEGWQFNNDWSVDNGNVTVTEGTFTMPARNVNVTGSFSKKNLAITKAAATNGSFDVKVNSAVVSTAQVGDEVTLVANPDPNYELKSWTVYKTGDESTKVTVTNNAFTMPAYPVTVAVEFKDASSGPSYGDPVTATITFSTNDVKIDGASKSGNDDQDNEWTITTVGTSSFTPQPGYCQIGASKSPATSITFTTTLPSNAKVTAMSAKFGGFNGTAGTVTLKVGDETLGTGSLNAANDVTVSVTNKNEVGKTLTVTVTGIDKGVKVYNISATYQLEN